MNMSEKRSPFETLAQTYDAWFDGEGRLTFLNEVSAFQPLLGSLQKPWLEIGVGTGRFAQALGIESGIDPSSECVRMARDRGINAAEATGEDTHLHTGSIGAVFIITTLCFVKSPLAVLTETNRILVNGGDLVLGLILADSPWGKWYRQKKEEGQRLYRLATIYSYNEVSDLLDQIGFLIKSVRSTLFQPPGKVVRPENPVEGYFPEAGFTVLHARKTAALNTAANER